MTKKGNILLVEDEENFGAVLKNYLELSGYAVNLAVNGNLGLSKFKETEYSLCLLDVMMPYKDGFSLAEDIRKLDKQVPIIFLTAKGDKQDQIKGYQVGADDYLTKPFDSELLLFKMESVLKRTTVKPVTVQENIGIAAYVFNPSKRTLVYNKDEVKLSPKEAALLSLLCTYKNNVMPRDIALNEIWKNDDYFATRSMDVYVAKLRKRLKKDSSIDIENIHSKGYFFSVSE